MTQTKPKMKAQPRITVAVGEYAVAGGSYASMPGDWYVGTVLWTDGKDVLLHRSDLTGSQTWRQVCDIGDIRAAGTCEHVVAMKEAARKACADLSAKVYECESALGTARQAVWNRLDEIAAEGLLINAEPPAERVPVEAL